MFEIKCPWCGLRSQKEFTYLGDASVKRPNPDSASDKDWFEYIYIRKNPKGWHEELWQHSSGCRTIFKVHRNTITHEIKNTVLLSDKSIE